jgi:hypothetical protein
MEIPLAYLLGCSTISLQSFRLRQLNVASNEAKRMRIALRSAINAEALALLATWIEENRERFTNVTMH